MNTNYKGYPYSPESGINLEDKDAMIEYLSSHSQYYTMNSWNGITSIANCMKAYKLNIPSEQMDAFYELIFDIPCEEFRLDVDETMRDFNMETGYSAFFNGRSGGYLVLDAGREFDVSKDTLEELEIDEVRELCEIVLAFDRLCDNLRNLLIDWLDNSEIATEEITFTKTVKTLVRKDRD